jgi:hypothetical protein
MKANSAPLLLCAAFLSGCGGGGGNATLQPEPPLPAVSGLATESTDAGTIRVTWEPVTGAQSYRLYSACEAGLDVDNFGAYDCGAAEFDVSSGHEITVPDPDLLYYVAVTAFGENGEGIAGDPVYAAPRYTYDLDAGTVHDVANGLEWMLCSWGQTWNEVNAECEGDLLRGNWAEIMLARPAGWSVPTVEQFLSIRFCDGEQPHFPEDDTTCEPQAVRGVLALPPESIGSASVFLTQTLAGGGARARTFSFGTRPGIGVSSIIVNDSRIGVYARFVRVRPAA